MLELPHYVLHPSPCTWSKCRQCPYTHTYREDVRVTDIFGKIWTKGRLDKLQMVGRLYNETCLLVAGLMILIPYFVTVRRLVKPFCEQKTKED
jgi:hypothetical protein